MRERVFIVGGGPSLYGFNFDRLREEDTIVVNDSVFHVPKPNYFITMDYTWMIKHNMTRDSAFTTNGQAFFSEDLYRIFVVAFSGDRLGYTNHGVIDKEKGLEYDLRPFDKVVMSKQYGGVGLDYGDFRCGSDSGYSAIQLAVIHGYKEIYLLGIDLVVVDDHEPVRSHYGHIHPRSSRIKRSVVTSISIKTRTHFHASTSRQRGRELTEKMNEFFIPYPGMLAEVQSNTKSRVFSCSKISRLNGHIDYIDVDSLI